MAIFNPPPNYSLGVITSFCIHNLSDRLIIFPNLTFYTVFYIRKVYVMVRPTLLNLSGTTKTIRQIKLCNSSYHETDPHSDPLLMVLTIASFILFKSIVLSSILSSKIYTSHCIEATVIASWVLQVSLIWKLWSHHKESFVIE